MRGYSPNRHGSTRKSPRRRAPGTTACPKSPGRTFGLRVAAARRLSIGFEAGLAPSSSPAAHVSFPKALCFRKQKVPGDELRGRLLVQKIRDGVLDCASPPPGGCRSDSRRALPPRAPPRHTFLSRRCFASENRKSPETSSGDGIPAFASAYKSSGYQSLIASTIALAFPS